MKEKKRKNRLLFFYVLLATRTTAECGATSYLSPLTPPSFPPGVQSLGLGRLVSTHLLHLLYPSGTGGRAAATEKPCALKAA